MITLNSSDARANMIAEPGWYIAQIKDITAAAAKDGSANLIVKAVILSDEQGNTRFEDVPVKDIYMNEKAFRIHIPLFIACGMSAERIEQLADKKIPSVQFDEKVMVGKKLKMAIKTTEWNGRKSNEAYDYLPIEAKIA